MQRIIAILFLSAITVNMGFVIPAQPSVLTVHLVGDSTMADKPGTPEENPERGWGQVLGEFFSDDVELVNDALNGRSSKSFREEGHWARVLEAIEPGDYVFIQFGHNDQKENDPARYTNPWSGYRRNLARYVSESRALGASPVILSSIVRRKFNEQGTLVDTHGPYPFIAREVAREEGVPFIDMQALTEDFVNAAGEEATKEIYLWVEPGKYDKFPEGCEDNTHLSLEGARAFASLVVEEIRQMDLPLAKYLK